MSGFADICITKSINFQPVGDDDKIKCFIIFERVQNSGENTKFSGLAVFERDVVKKFGIHLGQEMFRSLICSQFKKRAHH